MIIRIYPTGQKLYGDNNEFAIKAIHFCCQRMSRSLTNIEQTAYIGPWDESIGIRMSGNAISFCPFCGAKIEIEKIA